MRGQHFRHLLWRLALGLNLFTLLIALFVFAYMGYYSRFIADDYCFALHFKQRPFLETLIGRYQNIAGGNRFTNSFLFALAHAIGRQSGLRFFPALLIGIWDLCLTAWGYYLYRRRACGSLLFLPLLASWLIFYALWQAPQRYQTLYWYTSSVTHFAPLVFLPSLLAFLTWQAGHHPSPPWWIHFLNGLLFFLLGGFSEPPTAMLITAFGLLWLSTFADRRLAPRRALFFWPLAGLSAAMLVMLLAPANTTRMDAPPPLSLFLYRLVRFPLDFIWDSLVTQPIPSILSFMGILLLVLASGEFPGISLPPRKLLLAALLLLAIMYLLIAASFAPSIYGQSYPIARARFTARVIMTLTLMLEGALLGVLLSKVQFLQKSLLPSLLLLLLALYPLRASLKMWQSELPQYQQRAAAWDARHARILTQIAEGKKDLIVEQLNSFEQVKELDSDPRHWVNRCAAAYYGVESIQALPNYHP